MEKRGDRSAPATEDVEQAAEEEDSTTAVTPVKKLEAGRSRWR
jgi:hypothetical protein